MRYFIKLDELETKSHEMINFSKIDINDKIEELRNLQNRFDWSGEAHDEYIYRYNNQIENLKKVNKDISMFGEYLLFFKEHYNETNEKLESSWQEFIDEMKNRELL